MQVKSSEVLALLFFISYEKLAQEYPVWNCVSGAIF